MLGHDDRTGRRRPLVWGILVLLLVTDLALLGVLIARARAPDSRSSVFQVLHEEGLAAALKALQTEAARDSTVLRNAHQLAHALGRQAAVVHGGDVIGECGPAFASGCYHGVIEEFVGSSARIDINALERLCVGTTDGESLGPVHECVHGLGHGVLGASRLDVASALRHCDALSEPDFKSGCHSGVFMEVIGLAFAAKHPAHHTHSEHKADGGHSGRQPWTIPTAGVPRLDRANPYAPCDRYDDPYAKSCWLFQGFVILRFQNFDATEALRVCDSAPQRRVGPCYESIGHQLTGLFQYGDTWVVEQCKSGRPKFAARCAAGAALALAASDWSGLRAAQFCKSSPFEWKTACYEILARMVKALGSPDQRAALCEIIEGEFAHTCRGIPRPNPPT